MSNREFAEKNAGKYFRFNGRRVRVVGYDDRENFSVIVTKIGGWRSLDDYDRIIIKTKARGFWYIHFRDLKEI